MHAYLFTFLIRNALPLHTISGQMCGVIPDMSNLSDTA